MKFAAYLIAGVVIGLSVAWWQGMGASGGGIEGSLDAGDRAAIEQRISALERELERERLEREVLADRIETLRPVSGQPAGRSLIVRENSDVVELGPLPDEIQERIQLIRPERYADSESGREQRQIERFIDAGFAPDRAQWLLQREEELRMEALQARYDASRQGASEQQIADLTVSRLLREDLGDADYEKYLAAQGRPTSVNVREVLTNSPARAAGLLPGDEIVAYNGSRVFEMNELSNMTLASKPGSTVILEVERDGQLLQFYVEGGPLGITGGGRPIATVRDFTGGR